MRGFGRRRELLPERDDVLDAALHEEDDVGSPHPGQTFPDLFTLRVDRLPGPETARELGFAPPPDSEDAKRPFVEVSGRKGLGVKADDLIDRVIDKAKVEVDRRQADLPDADRRRIAEQIGVAAVRYFLVKFSRTKVIAFDIDEALAARYPYQRAYLPVARLDDGTMWNW